MLKIINVLVEKIYVIENDRHVYFITILGFKYGALRIRREKMLSRAQRKISKNRLVNHLSIYF